MLLSLWQMLSLYRTFLIDKNNLLHPCSMDRIFEIIDESDENIEFTLKISMLEIYNEKIQDLVDNKKQN